jgi:hypothetical protein
MNKSSSYTELAITLQSTDGSFATYTLTNASHDQKAYTWQARTSKDKALLASLVPGKSYSVDVSADAHGVQHWTSAREVVRSSRAERRKQNKTKRNPILDWLSF